MARAEEPEKPPNHERWIISYADFTTLLLATFVVMYSISSINSSKFQEMAEAFSTAFMGHTVIIQSSGFAAGEKSPFNFMPSPVHAPIITRMQVPDRNLPVAAVQNEPERAKPMGRLEETLGAPFAPPPPDAQPSDEKTVPATIVFGVLETAAPTGLGQEPKLDAPLDLHQQIEQRVQQLDRAFDKLRVALAPLIGTGQVRVTLSSLGVVIDINEVLLFNSGKAELTPQALPLIDRVAGILRGLPYQIQVNGFTDTVPIHTALFDSNWDLSATRAVSVVKRFVTVGVDPALLVGAGFGEYHPVAPNATPEGKSMNRRVSVVVVSPVQGDTPMRTPLLGNPISRGARPPTPVPTPAPPQAAAPTPIPTPAPQAAAPKPSP